MARAHNPIDTARIAVRKAAFESLYGPFAWAYDWVSRTFFLGQWRVWQRAAIPYLRGHRVLEVGMGTGNLQIDLQRAGYEPFGIDLSPQMLRQARRKAKQTGVPLRACRARAQALPFPSAQFNTIVSTFPSEYIIERETLAELWRALRPGGRLVIVPAGWLAPRGMQGKIMQSVATLVYGDQKGGSNAPAPQPKSRTGEQLEKSKWVALLRHRMAEAGFTVSIHSSANSRGACLIIVADKL